MKKTKLLFLLLLLSALVHGQREEYTWDYITFEEPYRFLSIDTTEGNLWEVGEGNNGWLYSFAGRNAIYTSGEPSYPVNNRSSFKLILNDENIDHWPYSVYLEFQHRIDTEEGKDGGFIEVSHDGGESWINVIEDRSSCINPGEWHSHDIYSSEDTLYDGTPGFSGRRGYESVNFGWEECLVKGEELQDDSLLVRFTFISDDNHSGDQGWVIDHIRLYSVRLMGAVEENPGYAPKIYPNPAKGYVTIELQFGEQDFSLKVFDLKGRSMPVELKDDRLDLNEYTPGVYLLKIVSGQQTSISKLIVE